MKSPLNEFFRSQRNFPSYRRFRPLISTAFVLMASPGLSGGPDPQSPDSGITFERSLGESSWKASWHGSGGRTYFPQYSTDLVNWTYSAEIKSGQSLCQGFEPDWAANFFVRLLHTDEPATDPQTADFDHDGIPNIVEVQRGRDPFDAASNGDGLIDIGRETVRMKFSPSVLSDQQLHHGQVLSNSPTGAATVALSNGASGKIESGILIWSGGFPGNLRGLLGAPGNIFPGRAAIATLMTDGEGDVYSTLGFSANGSLGGLVGANGIGLTVHKGAGNSYDRLVTNIGSNFRWLEMNHVIRVNTPYRTMVRRESNGFTSWIQGGLFAEMGAKVNSAVWFPVARWNDMNSAVTLQAGIYNSWAGPTQNLEFADIENPPVDATSALLDYERNKIGLHVPSLLKLPGGKILAAWQNASDHSSQDCVIKMALRDSRGVWGNASTVLSAGIDGTSNNGPVLHQCGDKIWLTYLSVTDHAYTVRKRDLMITASGIIFFSSAVTLFNEGVLLNHSLTLPSGRIVACWHTQSSYWKNRISYSDDQGLTWKAALMPEFANRAGEGFAALEADGTLASYWRTDRMAIYRSTSIDGGLTWTALIPTAIPCANMPAQGLLGSRVAGYKRPSDGKLVLIGTNSVSQREKLTAWLVNNGTIEGAQSLFDWDVTDGSAEGVQYPDLIVHPDDSMTVIFSRWQGGSLGSAELHSAINTFKVAAAFK